MIYLSANGEIRTNCNTAYDNDSYTIGNLNNESLQCIIEREIIEQPEVLSA